MYNYRFRRLFLALTLLVASYELLVTKCSAEETLTITTYYPSPYGSYNELRTYSYTYLATDDGAVGIGMTNPIATLTVGNNVSGLGLGGNTWVSLGLSGAKSAAGITMGSDTVLNRYLQMIWNDSSNYGIVTTSGSAQPLLLQTNGGDIGIGTNTPRDKLHLKTANMPVGDTELVLEYAAAGPGDVSGEYALGVFADGKFKLRGGPPSYPFFLTSDATGKVGIGTESPVAGLHLLNKSLYAGSKTAGLQDAWIEAGPSVGTSGPGIIWRAYGIYGTGLTAGVYGEANGDSFGFGWNKGALGYTSTSGTSFSSGVYGKMIQGNPENFAGYFDGNTLISGGAARTGGPKGLDIYYDADNVAWLTSYDGSAASKLILWGQPIQIGAGTPADIYVNGNIVAIGRDPVPEVRGLQMTYAPDNVGWLISDSGTGMTKLVLWANPVQIGAGTKADLYVTGNASIEGNASTRLNAWTAWSDKRLKKNIKPIAGALEKITQLQGVNFEWINPKEHGNRMGVDGGFIGQDVEKIFPNWISSMDPSGKDKELVQEGEKVKAIALPLEFDALLVESIKEQQKQIEEQQKEIDQLKEEIRHLKDK